MNQMVHTQGVLTCWDSLFYYVISGIMKNLLLF
jgi:hypothetical protein